MKKEKISVVVPIYNAETFLEKCLTSIVNQTYKDLEIILINDGSTDSSLAICEKYTKSDQRIKLINQENKGVSTARNRGIEESTGKYIIFIDADDYIELNMFEVLATEMFEYDVDMTMCGYKKVDIAGNILFESKALVEKYFDEEVFRQYLFEGDYYREILCNKLFKTDIIKKNNIRFREDIHINETIIFILDFVIYSRKFIYENKLLYNYVYHKNSALNSKFNLKKLSVLSSYVRLLEYDLSESIKNKIKYKYLYEGYAFAYKLKKIKVDNSDLKQNLKEFKEKYYSDIKNDSEISRRKKRSLWYIMNFNWLYCKLKKKFD